MKNNTHKYKNIVLPIICKYLPQAKIILYGSRARNIFHEGSDIDIALDNGNKIELSTMAKILDEVEESPLPICFDIVDFHTISSNMQKEILKEGVIWQQSIKN